MHTCICTSGRASSVQLKVVTFSSQSLYDTKPSSEPLMVFSQSDPWEFTSVKFESKYKTFLQKNALENLVCKMATILSLNLYVLKVWHHAQWGLRNKALRDQEKIRENWTAMCLWCCWLPAAKSVTPTCDCSSDSEITLNDMTQAQQVIYTAYEDVNKMSWHGNLFRIANWGGSLWWKSEPLPLSLGILFQISAGILKSGTGFMSSWCQIGQTLSCRSFGISGGQQNYTIAGNWYRWSTIDVSLGHCGSVLRIIVVL